MDSNKINAELGLDISDYKKGIQDAKDIYNKFEKGIDDIEPSIDISKILESQKKMENIFKDVDTKPFSGVKDGLVYIDDKVVGELITEEEKATEQQKEYSDEVDNSNKKMRNLTKSSSLLSNVVGRIGMSMKRQILYSIASALNPLRIMRKLSSEILSIFGLSVNPLENMKKVFDYLTNTLTPRLGATFKNIGENLLEYFANSNIFQNLTHQLLYFVYVLQETFNKLAAIFGWSRMDLFAKSTKTAKGLAKTVNQMVAGFDEINDIGSSNAGAGIDATPYSAGELFSESELEKAEKSAQKLADKLMDLKKWWDENKKAIEAVAIALGLVFLGKNLSDLLGGIGKVSEALGGGAGLLGILEGLVGFAALTFTIWVVLNYKEDLDELKSNIAGIRESARSWYQEEGHHEESINEIIKRQDENRKLGTDELMIANNELADILGLSETEYENLINILEMSYLQLENSKNIYDTENLTLKDKYEYLASLMEQYKWNDYIIEQLEEQGYDTTMLKSENKKYLDQINLVGDDLKLNTDEILNSKDSTKLLEDKYKDAAKEAENIGTAIGDVADTDFSTDIKVGADVTKFKDKLTSTLNAIGTTLFSVLVPGIGFANVLRKLASLDVGTNYVPNDQLAMIHKGEAVIPKKFNDREFFGNNTNDETNELLQTLIERVDNIEFNPYIGVKDIGEASVNYINNKSRVIGRSVIG